MKEEKKMSLEYVMYKRNKQEIKYYQSLKSEQMKTGKIYDSFIESLNHLCESFRKSRLDLTILKNITLVHCTLSKKQSTFGIFVSFLKYDI